MDAQTSQKIQGGTEMGAINHFSRGKNKLKALALWEVGIFETVFILVGLVLIFGVLNYFNILSLSQIFPKQLSRLPHNPYTNQPIMQQSKIIPIITPAPTAPQVAKTDTKTLISDILLPSLIPSNLVFQKQDVKNPNNFTFYGTGWRGKNGEIFIPTVEYNQNNLIIDRQVLIHIQKILQNLDVSSSFQLIKDYLKINPPSSFSCIPLSTINKGAFCEAFWEDNGIKKGIDITSPVQGLQETQLLYCEHHKETPAYSWKSCNPNYKDKGIASLTNL